MLKIILKLTNNLLHFSHTNKYFDILPCLMSGDLCQFWLYKAALQADSCFILERPSYSPSWHGLAESVREANNDYSDK